MPFGSILAKFEEVDLETADGKRFRIKNNFLTSLGWKIIGIPHVEMRARARKIFSFLPKEGRGKKILDAGCGPGIYAGTLGERGFKVSAIDVNVDKVNFLKRNLNKVNARIADLKKLPFKDRTFDYLICSDVLEHIKNDKKAFSEMARVLKKQGILIITVPHISKKNLRDFKRFGHFRVGYSYDDIKKLGEENSMKIAETSLYSGKIVERAFELNEKLYKNKFLLAILFYPLYLTIFIEEFLGLDKKRGNGIAVKFIKN